jgi:hypothetical protein
MASLKEFLDDSDPSELDAARAEEECKTFGAFELHIPGVGGIVRLHALYAALSLAWYVKRMDTRSRADGQSVLEIVLAWFHERLSSGREPAPIVHGFFGLHFHSLVELDHQWAELHAGLIFGSFDDRGDARQTYAWNAYLGSSHDGISPALYRILHQRYELAISEIYSESPSGLQEQLGWHLILGYLQRAIGLRDGLLEQFFERALMSSLVAALRAAIFATEAPVIRDQLDSAHADLLVGLWEWRREVALNSAENFPDQMELTAFDVWFASDLFPPLWALEQLHIALQVAGNAATLTKRAALPVMLRLAELASDPLHIGYAIGIATALLHGSWEVSDAHASRHELATIVQHGRSFGEEGAATVESILTARLGKDFLEAVSQAGRGDQP